MRLIPASLVASFALASTGAADTLPRGDWLNDGLGVRVTDDGLEFVTTEFEDVVDEELEPLLQGLTPITVFNEGCLWLYTAYISEFLSVNFDRPILQLEAVGGHLTAYAEINDPDIEFILEGDGLFCLDHYDCWSRVTARDLTATADVYMDVIDNEVVVTVQNASAVLRNYEYDTSWDCFIIETIAEILQSTIEDTMEDLLESMLETELPQMLNALFSELDLSGTVELFGATMGVEFQPYEATIDDIGGTVAIAARNITAYASCGPDIPGSRYIVSLPVIYGTEVPEVGGPYHTAISISDDALNAALYMSYDTGAICIQLDENAEEIYGIPWALTTTKLALFFPELQQAYPGAAVRLDVHPQAPPWCSVGTGGGPLEGQITGYTESAYLDLYVWDENQWKLALRVDTYYEAEILVRVSPYNRLKILVSNMPVITMEVLAEPLVDLDDRVVEQILPFVLRLVSPLLVASLDNYPVPTLFGYGMEVLAIVPDGPQEDFLSIYADLFAETGPRAEVDDGSSHAHWDLH